MKKYIYIFLICVGLSFPFARAWGEEIEVIVHNNTNQNVQIGVSWHNSETNRYTRNDFTLFPPNYSRFSPGLHRPALHSTETIKMQNPGHIWVITGKAGQCKRVSIKGNQTIFVNDILKNGKVRYVTVSEQGCILL